MKYYTDGWMMGTNPSPYGGGITIVDEKGIVIHQEEIYKENFTNNEAEIRAIKFALEYAEKGDTISTDSMCCLSWVNKGKSKARADLNPLFQECYYLKRDKEINLCWENREFNKAGLYNESVQDERRERRIAKQIEEKENEEFLELTKNF